MTTKAELLALADRVEALDRADREVDALIKQAVFVPGGFIRQSPINGNWCIYENGNNGKERLVERPRSVSHGKWRSDAYTSSIDAAMTLVPETCLIVLKHLWADGGKREWYATLNAYKDNMWVDSHDALNPSAAITLTAAAIRAIAAKDDGDE